MLTREIVTDLMCSHVKTLSLNLKCCYIINCLTVSMVPALYACSCRFVLVHWTWTWGGVGGAVTVLACDCLMLKPLPLSNRTTAGVRGGSGITNFLLDKSCRDPLSFCSCRKECRMCTQRQKNCVRVELQKSLPPKLIQVTVTSLVINIECLLA